MLGSWFTNTTTSRRSSLTSKPNSTATAPGGATTEGPPKTDIDREHRASLEAHSQPNPDQTQVQAQPWVTPHDRTLASILGTDAQPTTSISPPAAERVPTRPVTPSAEPLYDPFSGALLGLLGPAPVAGPSQPQNDELWTNLSRILSLQSDVASMHLQMEGISSRARARRRMSKPPQRQPKKPNEVEGEGQPMEGIDENVEDLSSEDSEIDADEEAETKKVRDEEFARLADQFTGRKDAIDGIMNKLTELSNAVTTFHACQNPTFEHLSNSNVGSRRVSGENENAKSSPSAPIPQSPPLQTSTLSPPPIPHRFSAPPVPRLNTSNTRFRANLGKQNIVESPRSLSPLPPDTS